MAGARPDDVVTSAVLWRNQQTESTRQEASPNAELLESPGWELGSGLGLGLKIMVQNSASMEGSADSMTPRSIDASIQSIDLSQSKPPPTACNMLRLVALGVLLLEERTNACDDGHTPSSSPSPSRIASEEGPHPSPPLCDNSALAWRFDSIDRSSGDVIGMNGGSSCSPPSVIDHTN